MLCWQSWHGHTALHMVTNTCVIEMADMAKMRNTMYKKSVCVYVRERALEDRWKDEGGGDELRT